MKYSSIEKRIHQTALMCGFENCGIIPLDALDGFQERYQERICKVPSSAAFYQKQKSLAGTRERFPWAKSVVVCTYWYGKYRFPQNLQGRYAKAYFLSPEEGRRDGYDREQFEKWMSDQGIRFEGGRFSVVPLRYAAMKAGLGIIRKNNFFYTEKGSYYNLMGYVIDQDCELIHHTELKSCSESCNLCQKACRTKALSEPYTMDPLKCVSYCTTFGKGTLPASLENEMLEEWLCGCDNCQDACPYNRRHNWEDGGKFSDLEEIAPYLAPERIPELSDDYLAEHVIPKTSDHMETSDIPVLRENARRALRFREEMI